MNAFDMAQTAYRPTNAPTRSPRSVEYEAFARATRKIKDGSTNAKDNPGPLFEALRENQRLWLILAESVADPENALSQDLRARLFYLAEFTMQHSVKVFRREATPDILVEINSSVMRGLRAQSDSA